MFVYVSTLYYTLTLLVFVLVLLSRLVSISAAHTLTILILLIVYLGAIIILIGYICAISPNLIVNSSFINGLPPLSFAFLLLLFVDSKHWSTLSVRGDHLTGFFYSSFGVVSFLVVIFMLFVTLLIVTSQYLAPKGPFRSLSL